MCLSFCICAGREGGFPESAINFCRFTSIRQSSAELFRQFQDFSQTEYAHSSLCHFCNGIFWQGPHSPSPKRWPSSGGQCNIPPLDEGMSYTQVSAGAGHSVILRGDGSAVACRILDRRQCDIPPLDQGVSYTQVSASVHHTVLIRSDGSAVASGNNVHGQCDIPP